MGIFSKKDKNDGNSKDVPYIVSGEWFPYKLYADKKCHSTLSLKVKNNGGDKLLTSVSLRLPSQLSFDETGLLHEKEFKLGELESNDIKDLSVNVYNNMKADSGEYTVQVIVSSHYKDYDHIMNSIMKKELINVV